jgi:WD repeat-containing protein 68
MSSPCENTNIINTLIDSKGMKDMPENISNQIVDELLQQDKEHEKRISNSDNMAEFNFIKEGDFMEERESGEKLVMNYETDNTLYSIAFQNSENCRIAVGTLEKNLLNRIEVIEIGDQGLHEVTQEEHEFPPTKLMWSPSGNNKDTLASSSDVIRLYKYEEDTHNLNLAVNLNNKKSKYCAPLTSFDWNKENNSILGTASIDTTCTIWDLNKITIRTQLIAHDKEVFDIAFSDSEHIFISTGADGSIRLFDLRSLDHSTIIYETKEQTPITKVAWNNRDSYYISALAWEKETIYVIDTRKSANALIELKSHTAPVTAVAWAPSSPWHICSVGEDNYVLIWQLTNQFDNLTNGPILSYKAPSEIYNVSWCYSRPEWIGVTFRNQVQLLRV